MRQWFTRWQGASMHNFSRYLLKAILMSVFCLPLFEAEAQEALPQAPTPNTSSTPPRQAPAVYHPNPSASYWGRAGVICGLGASNSDVGTKPTAGCGVGFTILPIPLPVWAEVGVMGPQANRSNYSGYVSVDEEIPLLWKDHTYMPFATIGYSRLFETGHALDYGVALALPRFVLKGDDTESMRIELKDYWTFANPTQHNVMLRVGFMMPVRD